MNEKVILNRPNGEQTELSVLAHFKVASDKYPNIKNVPILIVDTKKMDNGNLILEFYYEKSGLYQPIEDEQAWKEVKSFIIDIIKGNDISGDVKKVEGAYFNGALSNGRQLALNQERVSGFQTDIFSRFTSENDSALTEQGSSVADVAVNNTSNVDVGQNMSQGVDGASGVAVKPQPLTQDASVIPQSDVPAMELGQDMSQAVGGTSDGVAVDSQPLTQDASVIPQSGVPAVDLGQDMSQGVDGTSVGAEEKTQLQAEVVSESEKNSDVSSVNSENDYSLEQLGKDVEEFDKEELEAIREEMERHESAVIKIKTEFAAKKADNFNKYLEYLKQKEKDTEAKNEIANRVYENAKQVDGSIDMATSGIIDVNPQAPVELNPVIPTANNNNNNVGVNSVSVSGNNSETDSYDFLSAPVQGSNVSGNQNNDPVIQFPTPSPEGPVLTLTPPEMPGINQQAA